MNKINPALTNLFSLQSMALRTFLSLYGILHLKILGGSQNFNAKYIFFCSYDKTNKNKIINDTETNLFSIFFFYNKKYLKPEGQELGKTKWYLIVHDIKTK